MGERGRTWLARLPELVARCAARWELRVGEPYPGMSYNYIVRAERSDGTRAVLKLGVPGGVIASETAALLAFDGRGCVRLLDADPDEGALLLERLEPGETLGMVEDDDRATLITAGVMARVRRPVPDGHSFPTVSTWAEGLGRLRARFAGGTGPFPAALVEKAERLYAGLLATVRQNALLHGDLHHGNVLSAEREPWLLIDPQGLVGDPVYETTPFLRNNLDRAADPTRVLRRRARLLAEALGFDPARVLAWAQAESVLSAWWDFEDHGPGWRDAIARAEFIAAAAHGRGSGVSG